MYIVINVFSEMCVFMFDVLRKLICKKNLSYCLSSVYAHRYSEVVHGNFSYTVYEYILSDYFIEFNLCLSSMKTYMLFFRHKISNFFLSTFQRVWLEKVHEKTQYDRLILKLTVM